MKRREIKLNEISRILNLELIGTNHIINGLNLCNKKTKYDSIISYITSSKYIKLVRQRSEIKAVILSSELYHQMKGEFKNMSFLVADYPEEKFYDLHEFLYENTEFYDHFITDKLIGERSSIHGSANIENGVIIGKNVIIKQNAVIKKGTIIGDGSIIGIGSIVGSEGFQLIKNNLRENRFIKHAGGCNIASDVYIGDYTTICNSLFEETTEIGRNTKVDNHVHIAHNCIIGENCVLTAGVILSGSTIIGKNVWMAPNSSVSNKVLIENDSFVGIGAVVIKNVKEGTKIFGNPAKEI